MPPPGARQCVSVARMIEIRDLVAQLAANAEALARDLLPGGRRQAQEWKCSGNHFGEGDSFCVHLSGAKAGVWCNFITGQGGDALALVAQIACAGDMRAAVGWAKRWLGHDTGHDAARPRRLAARPALSVVEGGAPDADELETRNKARALFNAGLPLSGSPAARYLEGRGIDLAPLPDIPALRYHAEVWSSEARRALPALLAAITAQDGKFLAVHRTYLAVAQSGRVTKAGLRHAKMSWGRYAGGSIALLTPKSSNLVLTEGVENALSVAPYIDGAMLAAAVSLSNLGRLLPPKRTRSVLIVADNDAGNAVAQKALANAVKHYLALGLKVRVAHPPAGVKDANDLLKIQKQP